MAKKELIFFKTLQSHWCYQVFTPSFLGWVNKIKISQYVPIDSANNFTVFWSCLPLDIQNHSGWIVSFGNIIWLYLCPDFVVCWNQIYRTISNEYQIVAVCLYFSRGRKAYFKSCVFSYSGAKSRVSFE